MSSLNSAYKRFERQAGFGGYGSRAHQLLRRAREWQFDIFPHGKHTKRKIIARHLKVLCLALVWFDPTGSGMSIFPALKNVLARVNAIETERAAGGKVRAWNMRKLYRYLRVLEDSKMMGCQGNPHNRKPRNRFLFPGMLLKVKPGRRECVTREPANVSPVDPSLSPKDSKSYSSKPNIETRASFGQRRVYPSRFESFDERRRRKPLSGTALAVHNLHTLGFDAKHYLATGEFRNVECEDAIEVTAEPTLQEHNRMEEPGLVFMCVRESERTHKFSADGLLFAIRESNAGRTVTEADLHR